MQETKGNKVVFDKGQISIGLSGCGIIREQELELSDDVTIVYGHNNCGKTTLLKQINEALDRCAMDSFLNGEDYVISNYIPTNRVVVNAVSTEARKLKDIEDFINYKYDIYSDYSLHLKNIRDRLFCFEFVRDFVIDAVNRMFDTDIADFEHTYSDGMENIIKIYAGVHNLAPFWYFAIKSTFPPRRLTSSPNFCKCIISAIAIPSIVFATGHLIHDRRFSLLIYCVIADNSDTEPQ